MRGATVQTASSGGRSAAQVGGHGLSTNRDDDDDEGDIVSDGIVTWRRKLPDLSELGRSTTTVLDQRQHHHHRTHDKHVGVDARKLSIPAPAPDWSRHSRRDRRDAFAQQKSFSCEATCAGRLLPPTPDDLAAAARVRRGGADPRGGGHAYPVDRRRRMLMEAKKSYSLDDQIAPSHLAASDVAPPHHHYQHPSAAAAHDAAAAAAGRLQIGGRDTGRPAAREQTVSGERSPSGSAAHRKLLMLHTMRALQHDNYDTTETPTGGGDTHAAAPGAGSSADTSTGAAAAAASKEAAEPPPRVPPPTSRVDRLPIARLWSRLRFDRRAVTASGKK